jgi:signal transduction histidine kinase
MAALFTVLLGVDICAMGYLVHVFPGDGRVLWLAALAVALMLAVIAASFAISVFVVSRTNRIALTARGIMETGNLSQRIATDSRWDDLSRMSGVLNAFLERNEELVEGIRRVSDNIAHDLRTPLTRLRNSLESLRKTSANPAEIDALVAEADHLLGTFNALLRIARIEAAQQRGQFGPLRPGRLLRDVAELYEPVAEEKNIILTLRTGEGEIQGDRDLLFQAFVNLLDNAIKFSPPGSRIEIAGWAEGKGYACAVCDGGPGIPAEEREKVFNRFYRGEQSRNSPGNGLGLSLVAAVVALHHGQIRLEDAEPGLRIVVSLP